MSVNLAKERQYKLIIKRIEYVLKFGNGKPSTVKPFYFGSDLNTFTFPKDTTIIELYRQFYRDINETDNTKIKEETLRLKTKFFRGEYIPCLEAEALLKSNKLSEIELNPEEYTNFAKLVKEMILREQSGIVLCSGVPHLADVSNTYIFKLGDNGKIVEYSSIESLEIAASKKYSAILNGVGNSKQEINASTINRMKDLLEFGR